MPITKVVGVWRGPVVLALGIKDERVLVFGAVVALAGDGEVHGGVGAEQELGVRGGAVQLGAGLVGHPHDLLA